jgi:hypothetical protein
MSCGKTNPKPNPPAPFPSREGGEFKASLLVGERFGERFSTSCEKLAIKSLEIAVKISNIEFFR